MVAGIRNQEKGPDDAGNARRTARSVDKRTGKLLRSARGFFGARKTLYDQGQAHGNVADARKDVDRRIKAARIRSGTPRRLWRGFFGKEAGEDDQGQAYGKGADARRRFDIKTKGRFDRKAKSRRLDRKQNKIDDDKTVKIKKVIKQLWSYDFFTEPRSIPFIHRELKSRISNYSVDSIILNRVMNECDFLQNRNGLWIQKKRTLKNRIANRSRAPGRLGRGIRNQEKGPDDAGNAHRTARSVDKRTGKLLRSARGFFGARKTLYDQGQAHGKGADARKKLDNVISEIGFNPIKWIFFLIDKLKIIPILILLGLILVFSQYLINKIDPIHIIWSLVLVVSSIAIMFILLSRVTNGERSKTGRFSKTATHFFIYILNGPMVGFSVVIVSIGLLTGDRLNNFGALATSGFLIVTLLIIFYITIIVREEIQKNGSSPFLKVIALFAIGLGWATLGPYNAYYIDASDVAFEPLGSVFGTVNNSLSDLFLLITNPNAYYEKQRQNNVESEGLKNEGIEITEIRVIPESPISSDSKTDIRNYEVIATLRNNGKQIAKDIIPSITCIKKCNSQYSLSTESMETKEGNITEEETVLFTTSEGEGFLSIDFEIDIIGVTPDILENLEDNSIKIKYTAQGATENIPNNEDSIVDEMKDISNPAQSQSITETTRQFIATNEDGTITIPSYIKTLNLSESPEIILVIDIKEGGTIDFEGLKFEFRYTLTPDEESIDTPKKTDSLETIDQLRPGEARLLRFTRNSYIVPADDKSSIIRGEDRIIIEYGYSARSTLDIEIAPEQEFIQQISENGLVNVKARGLNTPVEISLAVPEKQPVESGKDTGLLITIFSGRNEIGAKFSEKGGIYLSVEKSMLKDPLEDDESVTNIICDKESYSPSVKIELDDTLLQRELEGKQEQNYIYFIDLSGRDIDTSPIVINCKLQTREVDTSKTFLVTANLDSYKTSLKISKKFDYTII